MSDKNPRYRIAAKTPTHAEEPVSEEASSIADGELVHQLASPEARLQMVRWAVRIVGCALTAEEIVHNAAVKLLTAKSVVVRASVNGLLKTAVKHEVAEYFRYMHAKKRDADVTIALDDESANVGTRVQETDAYDLVRRIVRFVNALEDRELDVLEIALEGKNQRQVARKLGVCEARVSELMKCIKAKFNRIVREDDQWPTPPRGPRGIRRENRKRRLQKRLLSEARFRPTGEAASTSDGWMARDGPGIQEPRVIEHLVRAFPQQRTRPSCPETHILMPHVGSYSVLCWPLVCWPHASRTRLKVSRVNHKPQPSSWTRRQVVSLSTRVFLLDSANRLLTAKSCWLSTRGRTMLATTKKEPVVNATAGKRQVPSVHLSQEQVTPQHSPLSARMAEQNETPMSAKDGRIGVESAILQLTRNLFSLPAFQEVHEDIVGKPRLSWQK